jgi:hypothetical protein
MKAVIGVIAALVTFGLAALGLVTAQQLSSPNHVAGQAFIDRNERTIAPAAQPAGSSTAPPSAAPTGVSAPAEPAASAPPPIASE